MNFNQFMSVISLRDDILDDLTYLQKHLRLIIKYHQKLSSKLYVAIENKNGRTCIPATSKNFGLIRQLMDELEEEMDEISREQKMLTDIVKKAMSECKKTWKEKFNSEMDQDLANGFITRALHYHYEKNYFSIMPSNVRARMSEDDLKKKFNQVKGDCEFDRPTLHSIIEKNETKSLLINKKQVKRESLLKPVFRKPTKALAQTPKKPSGKARVVEGRDGKNKKVLSTPSSPNSQAITHSRLNLLKALSKVKTEQVDNKDELDKFYTERCRAALAEVGEGGIDIKYVRSDEDYSERSSSYDGMEVEDPLKMPSRKRKSPIAVSEESSDGDYMKYYPQLPIEPPPKTEYSQEEFLSIFRLITPAVAESLKLRRSERKRRKCAKNEKNDYHYGNFDLNEAAYRIRLNNRKSIFYKPLHTEFD
ncbi:CLUMA_CG015231, isoform A [Clunio marinus]|uniref:CLUMA_CG015231, isoform A n=1 Tax=Clunio marinus TaxID=568069 RepID=A0A1J1ITY8_9DIPT|nr:CLUMA_CG015231, isoform A [Clunio marinus]